MQALMLGAQGQDANAKTLLLNALKTPQKGCSTSDILYFLAALDSHQGRYAEAIKYLEQVRDLQAKDGKRSPVGAVLLRKRIADCLQRSNQDKLALAEYQAALNDVQKVPGAPAVVREEILEGIVSCDLKLKDFPGAEMHGLLLSQSAMQRSQADPTAILSAVWSFFQLADVYRLSNQQSKLEELQTRLRPILQALVARQVAGSSNSNIEYNALMELLRGQYISALQPVTPPEIAWAAIDFRERTLPIIGWHSTNGPARATILCIHGLGLQNRSFEGAARSLNQRGYDVFALDVRGFGSWALTKGMEDLDYGQTIHDIGVIVRAIKEKNPGLPVFVLGESMGGAIAIRAGADLGDQINGIISSVPSAEQFQEKQMTLQTAMHFLAGPNKAFDVGFVAERATSSQAAREEWKEDPKARLRLSPMDLAQFAIFMRRTKPQAEKITKLPVLMAQGLADRLVKPEGTFELFKAVNSPDKTLYIAGTSEHLMFENASPDRILMDTVDSWIGNHSVPKPH
jgi:alpha-beta hydrolase superfamily lysophospholipase